MTQEQSKMYGLFYVEGPEAEQRLTAVSASVDKLTSSCPMVSVWRIQNDPNDKTLKRIGDHPEHPFKFLVREINHIV